MLDELTTNHRTCSCMLRHSPRSVFQPDRQCKDGSWLGDGNASKAASLEVVDGLNRSPDRLAVAHALANHPAVAATMTEARSVDHLWRERWAEDPMMFTTPDSSDASKHSRLQRPGHTTDSHNLDDSLEIVVNDHLPCGYAPRRLTAHCYIATDADQSSRSE